jgi:ubiquinone/menaquinone biosynthesis C-methylase UbiE
MPPWRRRAAFADVVSTDYVGALLERGRAQRAKAERLPVDFREADAENLPFPDASFDVVLSTFGVMFTANHPRAASELVRVCRPGGKIGLANWTPESFIGNLLKTVVKYVPPAPGVKSPVMWGNKAYLEEIFGSSISVKTESRHFTFRYKSPAHFSTSSALLWADAQGVRCDRPSCAACCRPTSSR